MKKKNDGNGERPENFALVPSDWPVPKSDRAEKAFLGSVFLAPIRVLESFPWLRAEHFFHPVHKTIFARMREIYEVNKSFNLVTVTQALEDANELEVVGGAAYVTELFTFVPTASLAEEYAQTIREKHVRRRIIRDSVRLAWKMAHDQQLDPDQAIEDCDGTLSALRKDAAFDTSLRHIKDILPGVADDIEERHAMRGKTHGLATGFMDIDRISTGLEPGHMAVIGARPGGCKTAMMLQIAAHISESDCVAIFSMEMMAAALARRLWCMEAKVDLRRTRDGYFSKKELSENLAGTFHKIIGREIYINDTPALTILEFRAHARRAVEKLKAKALFIDYLQLMKSLSKRALENRVVEVADVSMAIKQTAKELEVPIIVCAQLNREADPTERAKDDAQKSNKARKGRRQPKASELKDSGQIEQDADLIILLHQPWPGTMNTGKQTLIEACIVKQRDGPQGEAHLAFTNRYTRFENLTKKLASNDPNQRQKMIKTEDEWKEFGFVEAGVETDALDLGDEEEKE